MILIKKEVSELNEENLKEEIKGLSNDIRESLIQEAKKRSDHIIYNEDGSIDFMENKNINGIHTLTQGWSIGPPYDFDKEGSE